MTKQTMINNYRTYNAADRYILGFIFNHSLYMIEMAEIMPRFLNMEKTSQKNGGGYSLRLRITKAQKQTFIKKGAIKIASETILHDNKYNKGEVFERIITERMGQKWEKDNRPFYMSGDIETKDHNYQVKLDGATITTEPILKKARQALKKA